jgi:hypothetical protein
VTFDWLEGVPLLMQRWHVDLRRRPTAPRRSAATDERRLHRLYADDRDVQRLRDEPRRQRLEIWRDGEPFSQRFTGVFRGRANVAGRWEASEDGRTGRWTSTSRTRRRLDALQRSAPRPGSSASRPVPTLQRPIERCLRVSPSAYRQFLSWSAQVRAHPRPSSEVPVVRVGIAELRAPATRRPGRRTAPARRARRYGEDEVLVLSGDLSVVGRPRCSCWRRSRMVPPRLGAWHWKGAAGIPDRVVHRRLALAGEAAVSDRRGRSPAAEAELRVAVRHVGGHDAAERKAEVARLRAAAHVLLGSSAGNTR